MTQTILLDVRRQANSGVGRVSQWLAHHLPAMDRQHEYLFLVSPHSDLKSFHVPADRCVHTHVVPFAGGEFEQLPAEIDALGVDLYVNPQTTWSPLLRTPSISLVHDLWAINSPDWLPSEDDIKARFRIDNLDYMHQLNEWMSQQVAHDLFTDHGFARYQAAITSGHRLWQAAWAQYAAMCAYADAVVVVSDPLLNDLHQLFPRAQEAAVRIHNIAADYSRDTAFTTVFTERRRLNQVKRFYSR